MAVFRIEKTSNYTVMSNHHLRNENLSLKAKGLLSLMLSLPENWDYTTKGLAYICKDGVDSISAGIRELEEQGYLRRKRIRNANGQLGAIEYTILEQPVSPEPELEEPVRENPILDTPILENPAQLNKDISSKDKINTEESNTDSFPSPSSPPREAARKPESKRTEAVTQSAADIYRTIILENIRYDHLCRDRPLDREMLDEIVDLMVETVCSSRQTIHIARDDYPAELVKAKFMRLTDDHIQFALDCLKENTTKIRSIKQYLLTVLFNAPSTIGSYYTALVSHDLSQGL
jgi:hypothetical protein